MDPIDYTGAFSPVSPVQAFTQSLQAGAGIRQLGIQQQQQELQLAQQAQLQKDLAALGQSPTPQAVAALSVRYPQLSEHFKRSYDMLTPEQQQAKLSAAIPVYAAVQAGRTDVAASKLRDTAAAMENSGQKEEAARTRAMADLIEQHPETARLTTGLLLSSVMGPEKFATTFGTLGKETREDANAPAEKRIKDAEATIKEVEAANAPEAARLKNTDVRSQIQDRAQRLLLDKDKLQSDVETKLYELNQKANTLGDDAKKLVNDSTVAAVASDQAAGQMLDLAGRLEKEGGGFGAAAKASEWLKSATGNQDAMSLMRAEYTKLRNTQAVKNLPPGAASDADVKLAMQGFPPETADAKLLAGFLRGMAKLQQFESVSNGARAEWVNAVGHLGKPKSDVVIDGVKVPAGSTFVDFSRQFMQRKTEERAAEQAQRQLQGRGYMRWATQPEAPGGTVGTTGTF